MMKCVRNELIGINSKFWCDSLHKKCFNVPKLKFKYKQIKKVFFHAFLKYFRFLLCFSIKLQQNKNQHFWKKQKMAIACIVAPHLWIGGAGTLKKI